MIKAILIFNNQGEPRMMKFYQHYIVEEQQRILRETFSLVRRRDDDVCSFVEGGSLTAGSACKLIYRHYATLYFVFYVDSSESELGIIDLIEAFVGMLDRSFNNVCELDLVFHLDKVLNILSEIVMGGMVLETNMNKVCAYVRHQEKHGKPKAGLSTAPAKAVASALKSIDIPRLPDDVTLPRLLKRSSSFSYQNIT